MNFLAMLRELAKLPQPSPAELRRAEQLLRSAGYKIEAPSTWNGGKLTPQGQPSAFTRRRPKPGQAAPLPLPGWEDRPSSSRDRSQDDLLQGQMYDVESSNVHSIGMQIENAGDRTGTLMVRFLGQHAKGVRAGPGSLYGYHDVPVRVFRDFQRASSKGGFVWDELRVRGTIAGHQYAYELLGVVGQFVGSLGRKVENYVPRQAALKRGQSGQHFIKRSFGVGEIRGGRMRTTRVQSQLAESQASMRGPNPSRGPGADALRFMPGNVSRH